MQGYSAKLPLTYDQAEDGVYSLNKTLLDSVKQNFKMLLLTNPGERIMDSDFGVGLRKFLFQQDTEETRAQIRSRIISQTRKYLNFIKIDEINISQPSSNEENTIFINIRFTVPALNVNDELNISP